MSPSGSNKPEMACFCGQREPVMPGSNPQLCPACGDEMHLVGSAHRPNKHEGKH